MDYGRAIRLARAIAGVSQKRLAALAGLDPSHISLVEKGKRTPSISALERVAKALGVPHHVLTMLGAEQADLTGATPSELQVIGEALARTLATYERKAGSGNPKTRSRIDASARKNAGHSKRKAS